jgi:hypothetical protein
LVPLYETPLFWLDNIFKDDIKINLQMNIIHHDLRPIPMAASLQINEFYNLTGSLRTGGKKYDQCTLVQITPLETKLLFNVTVEKYINLV